MDGGLDPRKSRIAGHLSDFIWLSVKTKYEHLGGSRENTDLSANSRKIPPAMVTYRNSCFFSFNESNMRCNIVLNRTLIALLSVAIFHCLLSTASGQDTPQKAYEQLVKANKDKNLEKVFGALTEKAGNQLFDQMIQMTIQFKSGIIPFPNSQDVKPEIEKLFKEYKLDDMELPEPDFLGGGIPNKESMLEYQKKMREVGKKISKRVGMRKFDFIRRLSEVLSKSPFGNVSGMLFSGKIQDVKIKDDKAEATLKVDPKDLGLGAGGPEIAIEIPPVPVKFVKVKNKWKFDGVDEEKALEQMDKELPDLPEVDIDFE